MAHHLTGHTDFDVADFYGRYGADESRVAALVDGAPESLNTLREIADLLVSLQTALHSAESRIAELELHAPTSTNSLLILE